MKRDETAAKPFLKWAGGKGQLLKEIQRYYPFSDGKITKYAEPFVGGGAVLFDILSRYSLEAVYISDINAELIHTYCMIRDRVDALVALLGGYQAQYIPKSKEERKQDYLEKRERFNHLKTNGSDSLEKAALMIFLNKTCFNGLYRVNRKGFFNVPMGDYKNPMICDEKNLRAVSEKLQNVQILCGDYRKAADFIDASTFVYFDPPYRPITPTANFTAYTENFFNDAAQMELAEFVHRIDEKGAKIVLSNSDPKNIDARDDFFDDIYADHNIQRIRATRMINCKGEARGKIQELLISNFKPEGKAERDFDTWLSEFRESIADYGYYTDFEKVYRNVADVKIELNLLNSLIGSKNIKADFKQLIEKYPEVLKCIPMLLAVRSREIYCQDENGGYLYEFTCLPEKQVDAEQYAYFMEQTGLFDLLENHSIHSLVDYVTGVEVGLDSNGRKNRGGHRMEELVESFIRKAGFVKGKTYFREIYLHEMTERWSIDLSALSNGGKTEKRFDFVIKTDTMIYGIETNFYGSGGSKLNETARSYQTLAAEAEGIEGFTFIWLTDGKGWTSAKYNLAETFETTTHIYNIKELENGILGEICK